MFDNTKNGPKKRWKDVLKDNSAFQHKLTCTCVSHLLLFEVAAFYHKTHVLMKYSLRSLCISNNFVSAWHLGQLFEQSPFGEVWLTFC